jgi:hypothetical protein
MVEVAKDSERLVAGGTSVDFKTASWPSNCFQRSVKKRRHHEADRRGPGWDFRRTKSSAALTAPAFHTSLMLFHRRGDVAGA